MSPKSSKKHERNETKQKNLPPVVLEFIGEDGPERVMFLSDDDFKIRDATKEEKKFLKNNKET